MLRTEKTTISPSLFDTHNIAFGYGRIPTIGDNRINTQLKWNEGDTDEVRLFIRELLMIIRVDALQQGCNLKNIRLRWTYPLSFDANTTEQFNTLWNEEAERVLGISTSKIERCSESMAPYYYFSQKDLLKSVESAVVIDIGGGTTDYVYFANEKPLLASSIRFGCDALWGTGYSRMPNDRDKNGLYNMLVGRISIANDDLLKVHESMTARGSNVPTADIFNFWLSAASNLKIDGKTSLAAALRREARPLFVYHLCTILYTIGLTLKHNGHNPPRELIFCGGGSRYIDSFIDADLQTQRRMAKLAFDHIWNIDTETPNVIMHEKRKEATSYGALYTSIDQSPHTIFLDVVKAENALEHIETVEKQLIDMHSLYGQLLGVFDDNTDIASLQAALGDGLHDVVSKTLQVQVQNARQKTYHGTLLTVPALDRLIELTHQLKPVE